MALGRRGDRPDDIAVAIETPHGPAVEALMDRGIAVFAINPKQFDRFRDRLSPAGAKDDRRDALVLASALRTDRHCFRCLVPLEPLVVELREWSRLAEELKEERTRLANRIRQQLRRCDPQAP
jgi:transposase